MADQREQWEPVVRQTATEAGLDPEFVTRLVQQESRWDPEATSKKGAMGLMQLMPATARSYGVTNAHDPAQNIKGGIALLKDLSQKYPGRPDLIAAAYNAGPGAVDKAGGVPDYPETKDYVKKVAGEPSEKTLASLIRAKFPGAYQDKSDEELESAWLKKYPGSYDNIPRASKVQPKAAAQKAPEPAAQPDQPKAKEPEDYWGGFRKGWEEGGLGGFRGYVKGIVGAPGEVYRGIGNIIEDPAKALIGAAKGALELPGHIIQTTKEAGTNPEAFGEMLGSGIGQTAVNVALGKAPGVVARAPGALMHVPIVGPVVRGAKILRDIGQAVSESGEVAAEVPKTAPKTAPVPEGPGPGGKGWYQPWEGAERERIVAGKTPAPEPAAPAQPAAPAATSGQPLTVVGSPASKFWIAKNKLGVKVNAQQMPKAIALIRDGMEPEAAIKQVIGGSGATPAEELAKQLGTPSDAEVAADMGKRARAGQKTLMAKYGDQSVRVGGRDVAVVQSPRAVDAGDTLVRVNVKALDTAWAKDPGFHIGSSGVNAIDDRLGRIGQFLETSDTIHAPEVGVLKDGRVGFTDGRHRFAYLRDKGVTSVPVSMDAESVANARAHGLLK